MYVNVLRTTRAANWLLACELPLLRAASVKRNLSWGEVMAFPGIRVRNNKLIAQNFIDVTEYTGSPCAGAGRDEI